MKSTFEVKLINGMIFLVEIDDSDDINKLMILIGWDNIEYCDAL